MKAEIKKVFKQIETSTENGTIREKTVVTFKSGAKRTYTNIGVLPKNVVMFMLGSNNLEKSSKIGFEGKTIVERLIYTAK